ncbi:MAG TPA: hypothetical protein VKW08_01540 [Xanthobacteraceae bacterium]|nr:hypothetical protein [Xanthobacteraceae bacterium]
MKDAVFSPQDIDALNASFVLICKTLNFVEPHDPRAETVARQVIEIARTGERDPQRIHDLVLLALEARDQRSA